MVSRSRACFGLAALLAAGLAAGPASAVTLLETFDAPSPTANLGAVYPDFNFTTGSDNTWSVTGGRAVVNQGATGGGVQTLVSTQTVNPFADGGYIVEGDMGIPVGSSVGWYNVGILFGGNAFVFHPGYSGGAFRAEGIDSTNQNIGFTPAMGVAHHMQIQAIGSNQYRVTMTDPTAPLTRAYAVTMTDPSVPGSPSTFGFRRSGGGTSHEAFYDNLRLSLPHVRLNADNPTDGLRTDGTTVWADSGGTQSDATFAGGAPPAFQQGVDGGGNPVPSHTYQFNSSGWGVVNDTADTHAENFVIDGWFKLDRLPGIVGPGSWQMFAENGDWYQGAEWAWLNSADRRMYLYYSTGAGLGNDVTVSMAHGMEFLPDQFVHLAVAKEGSTISMFVNGNPIGTQDTGQTAVADRAAGITLGTYNRNGSRGGDPVNAQYGEFSFYNLDTDGRTAAQVVAQDYQGRYYDFHNHHPILLDPNDATDAGRTAAVPSLWADSGGNENDARIHGSPVLQPGVGTIGDVPVMKFNNGDYLKIPDSGSTHVENFLLEGWFTFDRVPTPQNTSWVTLGENGDLFAGAGDADTYNSEWYWYLDVDNINLAVWDTTATQYTDWELLGTPHGLSASNEFVHLAAAKDGDTLRLYLDGEEIASQVLTGFGQLDDATAGISIATFIRNGASNGDWFSGQLGSFNIWDIDTVGTSASDFVLQRYAAGYGAFFIPEPATWTMLGLGLIGLVACARRRRRTA